MNHNDYLGADFRVFGLHGVDGKGHCECGNKQCKALFKHPRTSQWQVTPAWSDEQLETMEMMEVFRTGFGVLVGDHIIIDIDPRNGGTESYAKMVSDTGIDFKAESGFVVRTGGLGWHIYFKRPVGVALVSHLKEYEGIDFKSSGYVVGCGSLHASGNQYEDEKGHPDDVGDAPEKLIDMLKKPEVHRATYNGAEIDVSDKELADMLSFVDADCGYDGWIKIGMAIHHATQGTGMSVWDQWSSAGQSYPGTEQVSKHWHSFGKSANPVTIGTLIHYAEQNGYQQSVTFDASDIVIEPRDLLSTEGIDLLRPPGFVGEVAQWINSQCRFPRERLAVAAALSAIGNIGGLRYQDEAYGVTSNQFIFCVAASATGKEAVQQAQSKIHKAAGFSKAAHGAIKSEQEIIRNLIDHQAACYVVDEMGIMLEKIKNARIRGGAAYLEGVVGTLMSAYSKANSYMPISGDVRRELEKILVGELNRCMKKVEVNEDPKGSFERRALQLDKQIRSLDGGLERPFLSLIGYTTPVTFNNLVDYEQSANGFFGRALIFNEKDTHPRAKKGFKPAPMPMPMELALKGILNGGDVDPENRRIEHVGERLVVPTDQDALALLEEVEQHYYDFATRVKIDTLEAIPRRAFELVLKVSLILAIPGGVRTVEHVRWAHALVDSDINEKLNLVASNMAEEQQRPGEALMRRLLGMLDREHGETTGVLANRCRPSKKEDVIKALEELEKIDQVCSRDVPAGHNKKTLTQKWFAK